MFATLLDSLESLEDDAAANPKFLWLHAQGMFAPWDGPLEFRRSLADEEDPTPPDFSQVPRAQLEENYDPDELLGVAQAYAGQVMTLDRCLAALLDYLESSQWQENTVLLVLGSRGFPLGEHLRLGLVDEALYGELLHVPCLWRMPKGEHAGYRSAALVQPSDVAASLAGLLGQDFPAGEQISGKSLLPIIGNETETLREAILLQGTKGERGLRTFGWHLRWRAEETAELFVKPDDRWEANEISDRLPEIVTGLQAAFDELEVAMLQPGSPLPALDARLSEEQ
jgi:arylsulfatase A-like enzyme